MSIAQVLRASDAYNVKCACPTGCVIDESIDVRHPEDALPVVCSSSACNALVQFVHHVCRIGWEQQILSHVRRTNDGTDSELLAKVWSHELSPPLPVVQCVCGRGIVSRDISTNPPLRQRRNTAHATTSHKSNAPTRGGGRTARQRANTLSNGECQSRGDDKHFFNDPQVQRTGSIFAHRDDLSSLLALLPQWKVNAFHVKLEDDCPQGNDDVRMFVLRTLGAADRRSVQCCLCKATSTVFDRYPLIDGTFFVSPVDQGQVGLRVRYDGRMQYLMALCAVCMEGQSPRRIDCAHCGSVDWLPVGRLLIGGMYTYDVLSTRQCCPRRCRHCSSVLPRDPTDTTLPPPLGDHIVTPFSAFSLPYVCPHCGVTDVHYVRQVDVELLPLLTRPPLTSSTVSSSSGVSSNDDHHSHQHGSYLA